MINKFVIIILFFCFSVCAEGAQAYREINLLSRSQAHLPEANLTNEDWQWLRRKRVLVFGIAAPNYPPFDITSGTRDYGGINADYLGIIGYNLNVRVKVRYYENGATLRQDLAKGEVDVIGNVVATSHADPDLLLSTPYVLAAPALIMRIDSLLQSHPPKHIAIERLYSGNPQLTERFAAAEYQIYDAPRRALEALSFNKLEAFIGDATAARYLINQGNLNNLRMQLLPQQDIKGFAFGLARDNVRLQRVFNAVLATIPESAHTEIQSRWNGGIPMSQGDEHLSLTSLERKWVEEHPRVRMVVNGDFAPLGFFDVQGDFRGLTADVMAAISSRIGLKFDIIRAASLQDSLNAIKAGKADIVTGVTLDAIWPNGLLTTRSYLFNSWVLVGIPHLASHDPPRTIALITGHPLQAQLQAQYPASQIVSVNSPQAGIAALKSGQAQVLVLPMISADYFLAREPSSGLRILSALDIEPARFVIGVAGTEYPLATILDKALLNVPPEDIHAMTSNWYNNTYLLEDAQTDDKQLARYFPMALILMALLLVLLLVALLIGRLRSQRQQVQRCQTVFDVTERDRLIEQLQQAKEHADSANRAKTTFLATMSHEIRTPLNAIIGMLELVLNRQRHDVEQDRELLSVAHESAHSLLALIGDILDISRIESDRLILHPQRADIRRLIESVATLFDGVARQKGLLFKLDIDAEVTGDVLIDPMRFKQVLSNLVSNAIKFTEQGQVALSVAVDQIGEERLDLRLRVTDTGKGIDALTQQRLFQPFTQGHGETGGAGLGLYICRKLMDMMGGTIVLSSEVGIGSEVTVLLSVARLLKLQFPIQQETIPLPVSVNLRILIVEDHPAGRMLLNQQLCFLGHRPTVVGDGERALAQLEQQQFDLMITDCQMPKLDGYSLSRQIRRNEQERQVTPLIIWGLTANAQETAREDCLQAGMDDCLFKPVNLAMLRKKLATLPPVEREQSELLAPFIIADLPPELRQPQVLQEFITTLITCMDEDGAQLHQELQQQPIDPLSIQALAHKLAGAARLVKAEQLNQACQTLHDNPSEATATEVLDEVQLLVSELREIQRTTGE
ncbi:MULTISPECIES: transporter substrate-binding domain-containing protein [unclassified Serratia (in: enterobacteria)]|uniref:ATP-binding protein n=1 Tax=unclassified Serratia (in: enterobacteria) TaxID=2647522 RepID=UPI00046AA0AC|nr:MULTISPECIES: transporter substrate-binding domain-containing protein [unclassified Serratia (in: enterobacteria)]